MVEVIVALIIIVIAIVAITGVFPLSMRVHDNAMRQSQAVDIAQELMQLAAYQIRHHGLGFSQIENSSQMEQFRELIQKATKDINGTYLPGPELEWKPKIDKDDVTNTTYYYYDDPGAETNAEFQDGIIRVIRTHNVYKGDKWISVTELDVVVAFWESDNAPTRFVSYDSGEQKQGLVLNESNMRYANNPGGFSVPDNGDINIARINVEVSWPGSADYADRKKVYFVQEIQRHP